MNQKDFTRRELESLNQELPLEDLENVSGGETLNCAFSCNPHDCPDTYNCEGSFSCSGGFKVEELQ